MNSQFKDLNLDIGDIDDIYDGGQFDYKPVQSGGVMSNLIESDTDMDEIINNQDNPGEDPIQVEDALEDIIDNMGDNMVGRSLHNLKASSSKVIQEVENDIMDDIEEIEDEFDLDLEKLQNEISKELHLDIEKEINQEFINRKVKEYIDNYNSEEYKLFQSMLIYIYSKVKVDYHIDIDNDGSYLLYKNGNNKYDIKLTPPMYRNINSSIEKIDKEIKSLEFKMYDVKHELINNSDRILDEDMEIYKHLQKVHYDLIHEKEILKQYYKKINEKEDEQVMMFLNFLKKKTNPKGEIVNIIDTHHLEVPKSVQDMIKTNKVMALEKYNLVTNYYEKNIINKPNVIKPDYQQYQLLIKEYLVATNSHSVNDIVEQFKRKLKKEIDFVIFKRPIIDMSKKHIKSKSLEKTQK